MPLLHHPTPVLQVYYLAWFNLSWPPCNRWFSHSAFKCCLLATKKWAIASSWNEKKKIIKILACDGKHALLFLFRLPCTSYTVHFLTIFHAFTFMSIRFWNQEEEENQFLECLVSQKSQFLEPIFISLGYHFSIILPWFVKPPNFSKQVSFPLEIWEKPTDCIIHVSGQSLAHTEWKLLQSHYATNVQFHLEIN